MKQAYATPVDMEPGGWVEEGELCCSRCGYVTQAVEKYDPRVTDCKELWERREPPRYCGSCGARFNPQSVEDYFARLEEVA